MERAYNDLSRLTIETTSIKPDGSGFTNSWDYPIKVEYEYNKGGSTTQTQVKRLRNEAWGWGPMPLWNNAAGGASALPKFRYLVASSSG